MDNRTWYQKMMIAFWRWTANRLPHHVVYFAVVRANLFAHERSGKGKHEKMTVSAVLGHWHTRSFRVKEIK